MIHLCRSLNSEYLDPISRLADMAHCTLVPINGRTITQVGTLDHCSPDRMNGSIVYMCVNHFAGRRTATQTEVTYEGKQMINHLINKTNACLLYRTVLLLDSMVLPTMNRAQCITDVPTDHYGKSLSQHTTHQISIILFESA